MSNPSNSCCRYPEPTPSMTRPPESWSSIAYSSATSSGWWNGSTLTATPSPMRDVRAAAAASRTLGDEEPVVSEPVGERDLVEQLRIPVGDRRGAVEGVVGHREDAEPHA